MRRASFTQALHVHYVRLLWGKVDVARVVKAQFGGGEVGGLFVSGTAESSVNLGVFVVVFRNRILRFIRLKFRLR